MNLFENLGEAIKETIENTVEKASEINISKGSNIKSEEIELAQKLDAVEEFSIDRFEGDIAVLENRKTGKIETIKYARENNIPFLGICLGMQMAVVEFARDVLGLEDANSAEFDKNTKNPVIHIMEEQKNIDKKGGTMRLGAYPCIVKEGSLANKVYGKKEISERHRHRYEFNNDYRENLENAGLHISGTSPDGKLVEIVEIEDHPYFIAGQFHPELKSRPNRPAPLFTGLVKAAVDKKY